MSQARIAAAEVINTARTKRVEATEEDPGDLTREERAHRERLQAEQDTIEQWIEDIANGVFDLSKLKIVDGVPQVYAYRWKHPHTGRIILRYSGSMLS